jgi:hypothetical protein
VVGETVLPRFIVPAPLIALNVPAINDPALGGIKEFFFIEIRKAS